MTVRQTIQAIKAIPGMTAKFDSEFQEYRVNFVGGKEETAYYTSDSSDAIGTARLMAGKKNPRLRGKLTPVFLKPNGRGGYTVLARAKQNPLVRSRKTKGAKSGWGVPKNLLPAYMEMRKGGSSPFHTPKNKRYLVGSNKSTMSYSYAASMDSAKRKGVSIAKKWGDSKFFVQNQVTGSILEFSIV